MKYRKFTKKIRPVTKPRVILCDVDGVLLNWYNAFEVWMIERGYERLPNTEGRYILSDVFGLNEVKCLALLNEFNHSEHTCNLKSYKDSEKYVPLLVKAGFRFIVVTSLGDTEIAKANRIHNLTSIFGDIFDEFVFLPTGEAKHHILERWAGSGLWWIEDHFSNAEAGYELGLKPILVDTTYNHHYQTDLFPRANMHHPWHDIVSIISKDFGIHQQIDLW